MRVGELLLNAREELSRLSDSARLDAEVLLAWNLGIERSLLLARSQDDLPHDVEQRYRATIERRKAGEPIAYITGEKEFWSLAFKVSRAVLIPRPETEMLVEYALKLSTGGESVRVLDLGCGSGCIGIALAHEFVRAGCFPRIIAVDCSREALLMTRLNAMRHGVGENISCLHSRWNSSFAGNRVFDIIVSNPPYVDEQAAPHPRELAYEPRTALFAHDCGFAEVERLIQESPPLLAQGGVFLCEIGFNHGALALEAASSYRTSSHHVSLIKDLAERDRMLVIQRVP